MEYTNSQVREIIKEYIHSEEDRKMVFLRLVEGWTFEKISCRFGLTVKTVRNRIHKCEKEIFRHIPG